jgi:hypothetical protein
MEGASGVMVVSCRRRRIRGWTSLPSLPMCCRHLSGAADAAPVERRLHEGPLDPFRDACIWRLFQAASWQLDEWLRA